jgi:hypothetical protein
MGVYVTFEVPITLRGRPAVVLVIDHHIQDGDLTDDGVLLPDELVFNFRVFDTEEEAEIIQLTQEERDMCYAAIVADLQDICDGES